MSFPRILPLVVAASLLAGCQDEVVSEGKSLEKHAALVQKDANALVKEGDPQGAKALADELEARIEDYAETYLVGGMCYVGSREDVDWLDEGCASTMGLEDAQRQGLDAAQEAFKAVLAIDRSVDPREQKPAWTAPPEMTEETASRRRKGEIRALQIGIEADGDATPPPGGCGSEGCLNARRYLKVSLKVYFGVQ